MLIFASFVTFVPKFTLGRFFPLLHNPHIFRIFSYQSLLNRRIFKIVHCRWRFSSREAWVFIIQWQVQFGVFWFSLSLITLVWGLILGVYRYFPETQNFSYKFSKVFFGRYWQSLKNNFQAGFDKVVEDQIIFSWSCPRIRKAGLFLFMYHTSVLSLTARRRCLGNTDVS